MASTILFHISSFSSLVSHNHPLISIPSHQNIISSLPSLLFHFHFPIWPSSSHYQPHVTCYSSLVFALQSLVSHLCFTNSSQSPPNIRLLSPFFTPPSHASHLSSFFLNLPTIPSLVRNLNFSRITFWGKKLIMKHMTISI